jgi:hypothetical protein
MTWALVQSDGRLLSAIGGVPSRRMLFVRPNAGSSTGVGCHLLVLARRGLGGYEAGAGSERSLANAATSAPAKGKPADR